MRTLKITSLTLLISFVFLLGCKRESNETLCDNFPLENPTLYDGETYDLINTVLRTYHPDERYIILLQETNNSVSYDYTKERLATLNINYDSVTLENFSKNNETSYFVSDSYLNDYVQLITSKELDCLFSSNGSGWERFYQKYPESRGYLRFSMPGINAAKNQAIISYDHSCGYLCGSGFIVLLEKKNNSWEVVDRILTWIS